MSKTITLEIPDEVFSSFEEMAESKGKTTEKIVLEIVINNAPPSKKVNGKDAKEAEERFMRWVGAVNSGNPHSADNEQIDADLAKEYCKDL